jgi:hypothetical protein
MPVKWYMNLFVFRSRKIKECFVIILVCLKENTKRVKIYRIMTRYMFLAKQILAAYSILDKLLFQLELTSPVMIGASKHLTMNDYTKKQECANKHCLLFIENIFICILLI